jgi:hypothetical protein
MPGISIEVEDGVSSTSISTSTSFIAPSFKRWRKLSRVASLAPSPTSFEQAVHCRLAGRIAHGLAAARLFQTDRFFGQIAADLFDIAPDIADLGELGRLDLHEGRIGQLGQTAADLGLAATRRPDHQDVLGAHLIAQIRREMLAPPTVAQCHGHGALGVLLANDMFVQCADDRLGGQIVMIVIHGGQPIVSTVTRSFVKTQISAATAIARRAIFSASSS